MNIEILKYLEENPNLKRFPNEGIPLTEIEALETKYNGGNAFPKALRELLFLAGKYCYVLNTIIYNKTQEYMQDRYRELMAEYNVSFNRPFFITEVNGDVLSFSFVYTDDTNDNPMVYYLEIVENDLRKVTDLKSLINRRIDSVKQGYGPF